MSKQTKNSSNAVATEFSSAAAHYADYDKVQRLTAAYLQQKFTSTALSKMTILDVGAGPGTDFGLHESGQSQRPSRVVALDIASGMLTKLKANFPGYQPVCGDAQALPFASGTFQLLYSNLAMQWCQRLDVALKEVARVLASGGEFHCALVADGSLGELRELGFRVNQFLDLQQITEAIDSSDWCNLEIELVNFHVHFDDLRSLLYSIKGVGASVNVGSNGEGVSAASQSCRSLRLRGRKDWQEMQLRAEQVRQESGLPLSYQVAVIRAQKV